MGRNKYPLGSLIHSKIHKSIQADLPTDCILMMNRKKRTSFEEFAMPIDLKAKTTKGQTHNHTIKTSNSSIALKGDSVKS